MRSLPSRSRFLSFSFDDAVALTFRTFVFYYLSFSATVRTCCNSLHLTEDGVLYLHCLTSSVTSRAGLEIVVFSAAATAMLARNEFVDFYFFLYAFVDLAEIEFYAQTKVAASIDMTLSLTSAAEAAAETKSSPAK